MIPGVEHTPAFKNHFTDGKKRFFSKRYNILPIGLIEDLVDFIRSNNYTYEQSYKEKIFKDESYLDLKEDDVYKYITNPKMERRDYQFESVKTALVKKRGILLNATGSGKSSTIYCLIREHLENKRNTLLVVPSIGLVSQMYNDFIDYGWDDIKNHVACFGAGIKKDYSKKVVISTFQSLVKEPSEFFEKFDSVIIDEAHRSTADSIEYIQKNLVNASYRIGLTGTLKEEPFSLLTIKQYLGPVIYTVKSHQLQEMGYASSLDIKIRRIKYSEDDCQKMLGKNYDYEKRFIVKHPRRNEVLGQILEEIGEGQNSLLLVHDLDHLANVTKYVESLNINYRVIEGKVKTKDRDVIRAELEKSAEDSGILILATLKTSGTGMNIKKLHNIINFGGWGKSFIDAGQVPGRGLRKIDGVKEHCTMFDVIDDFSIYGEENYCLEHGKQRISHYKSQNFATITEKVINLS